MSAWFPIDFARVYMDQAGTPWRMRVCVTTTTGSMREKKKLTPHSLGWRVSWEICHYWKCHQQTAAELLSLYLLLYRRQKKYHFFFGKDTFFLNIILYYITFFCAVYISTAKLITRLLFASLTLLKAFIRRRFFIILIHISLFVSHASNFNNKNH